MKKEFDFESYIVLDLPSHLAEKHRQLRARGKATKVVLVACMRKLVMLNAMIRDGQPWDAGLATVRA